MIQEIKTSNSTKRVLFLGRFQPFHNGHFGVVEHLAQEYDRVIVAIGTSQESHTPKNPLTLGERYWMIRESLDELSLSNVDIAGVSDVPSNAVWVPHLRSQVPPFDEVVSANPFVRQLFDEAGFSTKTPQVSKFDFTRYNGTRIRRMIANGEAEKVEHLMPKDAWEILLRIGAVERIKRLFDKEK